MRYNLLFDAIPFLTLIYIRDAAQRSSFSRRCHRYRRLETSWTDTPVATLKEIRIHGECVALTRLEVDYTPQVR